VHCVLNFRHTQVGVLNFRHTQVGVLNFRHTQVGVLNFRHTQVGVFNFRHTQVRCAQFSSHTGGCRKVFYVPPYLMLLLLPALLRLAPLQHHASHPLLSIL
jgi:hypothetical protein